MRKKVFLLITILLFFSITCLAVEAEKHGQETLNSAEGEKVNSASLHTKMITDSNGDEYIELNEVVGEFGGTIEFEQASGEIVVKNGNDVVISFHVNSSGTQVKKNKYDYLLKPRFIEDKVRLYAAPEEIARIFNSELYSGKSAFMNKLKKMQPFQRRQELSEVISAKKNELEQSKILLDKKLEEVEKDEIYSSVDINSLRKYVEDTKAGVDDKIKNINEDTALYPSDYNEIEFTVLIDTTEKGKKAIIFANADEVNKKDLFIQVYVKNIAKLDGQEYIIEKKLTEPIPVSDIQNKTEPVVYYIKTSDSVVKGENSPFKDVLDIYTINLLDGNKTVIKSFNLTEKDR